MHRGAQSSQISVPVIGSYARQPIRPVYAIEHFSDTYPEFVDMAMPSLYVAGRERDAHRNIRENHALLGNSRLIPWLSAGCCGEFEPEKLEFMVLESFLNGAGGITYCCFTDLTRRLISTRTHVLLPRFGRTRNCSFPGRRRKFREACRRCFTLRGERRRNGSF
ncbi:MAG: hypothetical protein E7029_08455 [Planctomycetaceae bacterium]|nr:hypothetical protein [Planctomycetaceae bacterium]